MPLAKLCLKTSVMVWWKREYVEGVLFSQWPLFSFLVFLYLNFPTP